MTISVLEMIAGTPWWVYVLFVFLMRIAYLATKPQIIALRQLYILPVIFFILSVISMWYMPTALNHYLFWLLTLFLGTGLGWLHFRALNIKALKNEDKLKLPGTWSVFVIIFIIFAAKYYVGFKTAINANWLSNPNVAIALACLYGLCTGLFIGRISYAKRCLKVGPYLS